MLLASCQACCGNENTTLTSTRGERMRICMGGLCELADLKSWMRNQRFKAFILRIWWSAASHQILALFSTCAVYFEFTDLYKAGEAKVIRSHERCPRSKITSEGNWKRHPFPAGNCVSKQQISAKESHANDAADCYKDCWNYIFTMKKIKQQRKKGCIAEAQSLSSTMATFWSQTKIC